MINVTANCNPSEWGIVGGIDKLMLKCNCKIGVVLLIGHTAQIDVKTVAPNL